MAFRDFTFPQVQERLDLQIVDVDLFSDAAPLPVREEFASARSAPG
jgi:hypothetical protein